MTAAKRLELKELESAEFHKQEEKYKPNYCITSTGTRVERAMVWGNVVDFYKSKEKEFASITIDDFTGTIALKAFEKEKFKKIAKGDRVQAICRIRQDREGAIFLEPEIIKKIDAQTELLRRVENRAFKKKYAERPEKKAGWEKEQKGEEERHQKELEVEKVEVEKKGL